MTLVLIEKMLLFIILVGQFFLWNPIYLVYLLCSLTFQISFLVFFLKSDIWLSYMVSLFSVFCNQMLCVILALIGWNTVYCPWYVHIKIQPLKHTFYQSPVSRTSEISKYWINNLATNTNTNNIIKLEFNKYKFPLYFEIIFIY